MKKHIFAMAFMLIERNGKASNKEIKDALHRVFENDSTFQLGQSEVSKTMDEMYQNLGLVRELNTTIPNLAFYEYSIDPANTLTGQIPTNVTTGKQLLNDFGVRGN